MTNDILKGVWPEWHIVKRLGSGSFGVVYEAIRTDHAVESHAAIKVISIPQNESEINSLRAEGLSEDETRTYLYGVVNSFVSEIQLMETFKGVQNIVSVEDYKVVEKTDEIGWDVYIRMELLTPFNNYVSGKTLSEKEVIKLGVDICTALERCAQRNVIHRDIKPENIFLNAFGDFKLGDFGIARKLENVTGGLSQKGTYNYMAPEIEKSSDYDATVDLYSLGLVLYRLMNENRLPFLEESQLLNPNERMTAIRRRLDGEPLPEPSHASSAMTAVILCACAPEPGRRFATATDMKNALINVANGTYSGDLGRLNGTREVRRAKQIQASGGTVSIHKEPKGEWSGQQPGQWPASTPSEQKKMKLWGGIAACCVVLLGIIVYWGLNHGNSGEISPALPSISAGYGHTVGLKSDGTVIAIGYNEYGGCDVDGWTDIVSISAGGSHTVGLKSDGTVIAVGHNEYGGCNVDDWTDITAISAGDWYTVGLRSDGTVAAVGYNEYGQCNVGGWTDIVAISAGGEHAVGLRSDGTVVAVGSNEYGQCEVDNWTDIVAISAGYWHTAGLKSDGTVVAVGTAEEGQCDVDGWTDIAAISAGRRHTVGLKSDGTVVAVGSNEHGQCDVDDWTDVAEISAGYYCTVALKSDGTMVAIGRNKYDQCSVTGWTNIRMPG